MQSVNQKYIQINCVIISWQRNDFVFLLFQHTRIPALAHYLQKVTNKKLNSMMSVTHKLLHLRNKNNALLKTLNPIIKNYIMH